MADKSLIGKHVCPECGKSFEKPQQVGAHRARAHGYRREENPGPALIEAVPSLQRPLDEEKLEAYKHNFSVLELESSLFGDRLLEFLPHLAQETRDRFRRGDDTFVDPFLTLYLDLPVE